MWLSKRSAPGGKARAGALTGPVTLAGEQLGAWLEGERRGVEVYAPGGYYWAPQLGERLLVLKAGEDGEQPCAVGVEQTGEERLAPGEILIRSGKGELRLKPNGTLAVKGLFTVNGVQVGPDPVKEEEDE